MVLNTDERSYLIFISLGSNMGDRKMNLEKATKLIDKLIGEIQLKSSLYKTEGWGNSKLDWFLNMAIKLVTQKSPNELLNSCLEIEDALGRRRINQNGYQNRVIDIDITLIDDLIIDNKDLKIPHPRMEMRNFVLFPLAEIASNTIHPRHLKTIQELKNNCPDDNLIERIE